MQILFSLILISCMALSCSAAAFSHYIKDPAHPGKCVINDLILSPGEIHYDVEKCEKALCEKRSLGLLGSFYSCGIVQPPDHCKLGEPIHPNAPYPDCCPQHVICNSI